MCVYACMRVRERPYVCSCFCVCGCLCVYMCYFSARACCVTLSNRDVFCSNYNNICQDPDIVPSGRQQVKGRGQGRYGRLTIIQYSPSEWDEKEIHN